MAVKYKRGSDGYFQARVWDGTYTDSGKRHYIRVRSKKSSRDLELKVSELNRKREQREGVRQTNETFVSYARLWEKLYKSGKSANTQAMYENIIEKHLTALEGIPLQQIDRIHIQTVINNADGHARTQQQIYMTCRQILKSAVADQLFPANIADNIFASIDRPDYSAGEKRPLASYEKDAVFKADLSEQDKVFLFIIYGCGLRRGEALALTVFDVNLNDHTVTVSRSHEYTSGQPVQKEPKSANGYRTVPIPDRIFGTVRAYIEQLRASGGIYLFRMKNGKPMSKSSYDKMWARITAGLQAVCKQEITGLTAHVFRHNYCTNLCYQIPVISIKHIAYLMGDTEKMVLDVCNHIVLEKEDAAKAVNAAL